MHRIRTWAHQKAHGPEPLIAEARRTSVGRSRSGVATRTSSGLSGSDTVVAAGANDESGPLGPDTPSNLNEKAATPKPSIAVRFFLTVKDILFSSIVNVLLVFVPVGIAAHFAHLPAGVVFAMNAIAIVPLAGLLSFATESVAKRLGDTIGALMNVTFGNAVELIIFIALVKNEIRIVQASLVGSILANLLLILGMCFLLGGLRYREQIYNSTVTQMSACLLSLSVSSLLLPTAFHASFNNADLANTKVLQVSRGTSVVLLLVYLLYLLFQLNSHAYMYESTPQEVIEREMVPGPAAGYFNHSSSSSSESSSSSSDSDSDQSNGTARRIKRALKKGRNKIHNRNSSLADDLPDSPTSPSTSVPTTQSATPGPVPSGSGDRVQQTDADAGIVADDEEEPLPEIKPRHKRKHKHHRKRHTAVVDQNEIPADGSSAGAVRRVDFAAAPDVEAQAPPKPKPFSLRTLANPAALSKTLSVNVFNGQATPSSSNDPVQTDPTFSMLPRPQPQLRRATSMPVDSRSHTQPGAIPPIVPIVVNSTPKMVVEGEEVDEEEISRTTAILLLLVSTGLVALCAEFMVDSINEVVEGNSGLSEAFIGLVLLPIVGNAAEHVTGVTVAMKNKMDLAIGVALGSSIQIAIFVTPIVVILGWIMNKDMSLYFTLFETVSMFVSTFIVNFLVLDGRSNYLEGALLCSAYVIIAVAAFFYPDADAANSLGGGTSEAIETVKLTIRGAVSWALT